MEQNNDTRVELQEETEDQSAVQSGGAREKPKKKNNALRVILKILIWLVIIAAVIYLTLFLASKIGDGFDSVQDVIDYIRAEIGI